MSTTSSSTRGPDVGLVPLHERLRYMLAFRAIVAVAVLALWVGLPSSRHVTLPALVTKKRLKMLGPVVPLFRSTK